ncbi:MAG: hypothetical protein LBH08_00435 [Puniceicoccales bacterium]|jgi:serine/threonine protein kinase|nr:hypothetical protein [Puniceicoccales bacterium]
MDGVKQKLRELAAIESDGTFSEEEKKSRIQHIRNQLAGLSNIVPIIGIAQVQHQDKSHPENTISETVEILPKINGHTLGECIEKKLPPYNTYLGSPKSQDIALDLSLQLAKITMILHSCSYINTDSNPNNIMVIPNDSSFTLKLIDWESLVKNDSPNDFIKTTNTLGIILYFILPGKQCTLAYRLHPHNSAINKKNYIRRCYNNLKKAKIYSPEAIATIIQFYRDILTEDKEKSSTVEAIIPKLEALPTNNKPENDENKKNSDENLDENEEDQDKNET